MRGGSWHNNERLVRCAYRNRNNPNNRNNGVRVAVSHIFYRGRQLPAGNATGCPFGGGCVAEAQKMARPVGFYLSMEPFPYKISSGGRPAGVGTDGIGQI